ncbi:MAG: carbohydrate ABC transporter permease [Treponema sp.]|jgi:ABC-type glycerol-3-phosphate transport system permease component|nr:carbohydrate ABC transporter permease [Treponema sp.]
MVTAAAKSGIRESLEDKIFNAAVYVILSLMFLVVFYPLVFIIASSFSSPDAVASGKVILWPVDPGLEGYRAVFTNNMIGTGYFNSVVYTVFGTLINVALTLVTAYALACPTLPGRNLIMVFFTFTMLFDGGMIPNYILLRNLRMLNTRWAILIPGAIGIYNMIITRTFISSSIPAELREAADIDGCSDIQYFWHCILPLSKAVIAVISLYYAVANWNAYFNAFLYLTNKNLFPLQIVLRDILIANTIDAGAIVDPELMAAKQGLADLLKYSLIIVASLPVMTIYPFIQKYFIQGVMIGSIKG